jgi:acetyl-CoA carboxylase carboxyltransferase component
VDGINVGAQSYWNAEATMLLHCRGALIMTPQGSMLLTGKRALEYAGSVAAEDNNGIGGFERVMGPNGEAQYFAPDLTAAYQLLFRHLALTATIARRIAPAPPAQVARSGRPRRDAAALRSGRRGGLPHRRRDLRRGDQPRAQASLQHPPGDARGARPGRRPLERWAAWQGAESAVVWEGALGGDPVCCIGIESRPIPRRGDAPADGPDHWTSGTLFPLSSRKVARAINAASGAAPWWCWPTSRASTDRPSRCATSSSNTAPRSAARW